MEELLKNSGWKIECESPLEIRHEDGSFATEQAAIIVIAEIRELQSESATDIDHKKESINKLIRTTLEHCLEKITLYNKRNQEYLGGVEATRLLSNIREVINIIDNQ